MDTTSTQDPTTTVGPITKKAKSRPAPYSKPILLTGDRRSSKRKSISWQSDEKIHKVHYFEYIADERVNVTKINNPERSVDPSNAAPKPFALDSRPPDPFGASSNSHPDYSRPSNGENDSNRYVEYMPWQIVLIDCPPEMPSPGWNSVERSAQAERETYVLGAIDLPGQPSTLDEPDGQQPTVKSVKDGTLDNSNSGNSSINCETGRTKDEASSEKIIPLENPNGLFTEYPDMYNSEIVNGVRIPTDNPQPTVQNLASFGNQQSQLLPNQYQQQFVNVTQNPFTFQDMSAQFQQPQQFPFQQQPQSLQLTPFANHQQQLQVVQQQQPQQQQQPLSMVDQQAGLTGPIMPWLNYPFNQVNENSHAHLFRRPAT